jgi:hypothetical protein
MNFIFDNQFKFEFRLSVDNQYFFHVQIPKFVAEQHAKNHWLANIPEKTGSGYIDLS